MKDNTALKGIRCESGLTCSHPAVKGCSALSCPHSVLGDKWRGLGVPSTGREECGSQRSPAPGVSPIAFPEEKNVDFFFFFPPFSSLFLPLSSFFVCSTELTQVKVARNFRP